MAGASESRRVMIMCHLYEDIRYRYVMYIAIACIKWNHLVAKTLSGFAYADSYFVFIFYFLSLI